MPGSDHSAVLAIAGAAVDRPGSRVVLDRLQLQTDSGYDSLEFTEIGVELPGSFGASAPCVLTIDGTVVFRGVVVASFPSGAGRGPIDVGYRAMGLEWLANRVPITAADGTGTITLNQSPGDEGYTPSTSGLSVGAILKRLFDLHAAPLAAAGVTAYDPDDLDALTVVPPEPVRLSGGLWNAVRALLRKWCNKYVAWIDPADGSVKVKSQLTDLTPLELDLDADPVLIDRLSRDHSESATAVLLRGGPDVQAAYLDFADEGLAKGWTPAEEADYDPDAFARPGSAADAGAVTAISSTTITVQSDDPARTWPANYWNGRQAVVVAYDPAATGITFSESRPVTACTALAAAGTSVLSVDPPFDNSGYSRYAIRGLYDPTSLVWRKVLVNNPYVAKRLVQTFPRAVPWSPADGVALAMTATPQAALCHSADCSKPWNEFPATFDVVPFDGTNDGFLVFHSPINKPFGGPPCDVKALVPYSRGALSVRVPESGWEGTANAVDGLERVWTVDRPEWRDLRDSAAFAALARELLDSVKNTVVEGTAVVLDLLPAALVKGAAVRLVRSDPGAPPTGFETADALVRSVTLDWHPRGGAASRWTCSIAFSNRMKPFTGDRLYSHPAWGGRRALADAGLDYKASAAQSAAGQARAAKLGDPNSFLDQAAAEGPEPFLPDDGRDGSNSYRGPRKETGLSDADRRRAAGKDPEHEREAREGRAHSRALRDDDVRKDRESLAATLGKDPDRERLDAARRDAAKAETQRKSDEAASRARHAMGRDLAPADKPIDAELERLAGNDPF